ncbi:MAG: hypothetical protein ACOYID_03730 [Eubacteriales bacterium]|jgi:fumarate reductase subunit D|nr:hypothetical protein [Clostridiales bacterium]
MIKFIKDNSYLIFKMMVNQLGMMMFGLVLSMATYNDDKLHLATSIFAVGFYMVLLYMMCWEYGQKEKVRVDHGRLPYMPLKGLYMSLCANVINILLAIILLFGYINVTDIENQQPSWAYSLYDSTRFFALVAQAMYIGIINMHMRVNHGQINPVMFFVIILPSLAASALGYYFGLKDRRLLGFLGLGRRSDDTDQDEQE